MKMGWFIFALIAMVSFTVTFLLIRRIGDLGVKSEVILVYYFAIAAILLLVYTVSSNFSLSISKTALILLFVVGFFGVLGNIFLVHSLLSSPNPGYSLAISGVHILLVAIVSVFIFGSEFTLLKGLGTVLAVLGIILIGWK